MFSSFKTVHTCVFRTISFKYLFGICRNTYLMHWEMFYCNLRIVDGIIFAKNVTIMYLHYNKPA